MTCVHRPPVCTMGPVTRMAMITFASVHPASRENGAKRISTSAPRTPRFAGMESARISLVPSGATASLVIQAEAVNWMLMSALVIRARTMLSV